VPRVRGRIRSWVERRQLRMLTVRLVRSRSYAARCPISVVVSVVAMRSTFPVSISATRSRGVRRGHPSNAARRPVIYPSTT
jgi:hypothetical protein